MLKRAGVLGWPVDHSLSPNIHRYWLNKYNIHGQYDRVPVEPKDFATKIQNLKTRGFVGGNVTVPHKQTALKCVDEADPLAIRIGAVNTFVFRNDSSLYGFNTDGFGFLANLTASQKNFNASRGPAVVLGAGGAARAIIVALQDAGVAEIRLLNRTQGRAQDLADELQKPSVGKIQVLDWRSRADHLAGANLLVNTTILGMKGQPSLDIDLSALPRDALVNDIVYAPLETNLLKLAKRNGHKVVDGLGMLLHQARPGFEAWFGPLPTVDNELRTKILKGIG